MMHAPSSLSSPVVRGRFGAYGGQYVPETIMPALDELEAGFRQSLTDAAFQTELRRLLRTYVGRPTPIYDASGQALLAKRMGKRRIIAEPGAGQHGVATATICAKLGLECVVYMGEADMQRQAVNVYRMRLLGAEVRPVTAGTRTLKDAISEAFRDWVTTIESSYYLIGSVVGPHPYPELVRTFQAVISEEARAQCLATFGRLPDRVVACVGLGA